MALDGDEVDDDDDRDMFCIPPTLWVNADYRLTLLPYSKIFLFHHDPPRHTDWPTPAMVSNLPGLRPSGSMRTIDIAAVLHRKEAHEEKTKDHYHGHAGEVFPELARTSIATDRFVLLSRPSSTHKINK